MRVTEILISLLIGVLVLTGMCSVYSSLINGYSRIHMNEKRNDKILKVDYILRKEISVYKVPYWLTTSDDMDFLKDKIRNVLINNQCMTKNISVIRRENTDCGIIVEWECDGKDIVTKGMFSTSRCVLGK